MDGDAALGAFIDRLKKLEGLPEATAKEAAPRVEALLAATASAGTDPYGKAWEPKNDGTRALSAAPTAIKVRALGGVVVASVAGGYFWQNRLKGAARRATLPDAGRPIPRGVADALAEGARVAFHKLMGA